MATSQYNNENRPEDLRTKPYLQQQQQATRRVALSTINNCPQGRIAQNVFQKPLLDVAGPSQLLGQSSKLQIFQDESAEKNENKAAKDEDFKKPLEGAANPLRLYERTSKLYKFENDSFANDQNKVRRMPFQDITGPLQQLHAGSSKFHIYEDESIESDKATEDAIQEDSLPENVTKLYKFQETPNIFVNDSYDITSEDSPMVLDTPYVDKKLSATDELFNCRIYDEDIYVHLRELETKFRPKLNYMHKQPDITYSMRAVLVDWLVDVAESYSMQTPTVYLAVSYTDRFLSQMSVLRGKLQLVGTSSLLIAAKYEEIYPPEVHEFVYVTDDTYTKKQVVRMEHLILKVLAFDLSAPTAYDFLQRYCCVTSASEKVRCLAEYICELSLLEGDPFMEFLPSVTAASSLYLANYTLDFEPWSAVCIEKTGYNLEDLSACIQCLYQQYIKASDMLHRAIPGKYKAAKYHAVADISPPEMISCTDQCSKI